VLLRCATPGGKIVDLTPEMMTLGLLADFDEASGEHRRPPPLVRPKRPRNGSTLDRFDQYLSRAFRSFQPKVSMLTHVSAHDS